MRHPVDNMFRRNGISGNILDLSPDNKLMMQVKDGDLDKLGPLFEKYKLPLYRYFFHRMCVGDDCEAMVQNVFIRILKYRNRFEPVGEFRSWMYSIAHNLGIDHLRKHSKWKIKNDVRDSDIVEESTTEDMMIRSEESLRLKTAMNMLRDDYREVLVLSRFDNLRYREIGEITGSSEGAVKVRIHRALRELRILYDKLEK